MDSLTKKQTRLNLALIVDEVAFFVGLGHNTVSRYDNDYPLRDENVLSIEAFYKSFKKKQDKYINKQPPIQRNEQHITGKEAANILNVKQQRFNNYVKAKFIIGVRTGAARDPCYLYHPNDILLFKHKRKFIINKNISIHLRSHKK